MKQNITQQTRRKLEATERKVRKYRTANAAARPLAKDTLRIVPLGGQNGIGEKNMIVVEYNDDALVLDCGFALGIDLPGVNYAIPAVDYLHSIRHKLRGYVISHGHLDHIGGLMHVVPDNQAPIIGSRFTIGMVNTQFEKAHENGLTYQPKTIVLDMDTHEQLQLGALSIELIRVTHAIPESSAIVVNTPVGRLINTGDFRLDPEPLDKMPTDIARLEQLGKEGVLLLMSESTNATKPGRTPTEHTLQDSFDQLIGNAKGRVFASIFSSNMNRIQMIVNAAVKYDRKVALDGRSMLTTAELAVRLGNLKIPKGTLIAMRETVSVPDNRLIVICTGGQGEPGAAMSRMSTGEHQYIKLKRGDSVVISSTPIPGNEISYQQVGDDLALIGAKQYRHTTHEVDGCGPLHVSGHGNRDEHAEMIQLTRPKYLMPIYGGPMNRQYHKDIGLQNGLGDGQIVMANNGSVIEITSGKKPSIAGKVTAGSQLVDQTGNIVPELVIKDKLLLQDDGFLVVLVSIDRWTGRLLSSPDIITRGSFSIRDNSDLMESIRREILKIVGTRKLRLQDVDDVKLRIRSVVSNYLSKSSKLSPMIIPVVKIVPATRNTMGGTSRAAV
ncbi:ribonuclease J [Candidatus Saccharibacteria bacterium]|nr:ribonuclease J [Candidatus Saccharibacteria bacterium]